jgi:sarcosine oxidase subunit delta
MKLAPQLQVIKEIIMKIMNCPLNGPRNISEFICFGEVTDMPNPNELSDEQWADFIWMSNNTAGVVREWWCHTATSYWFIAERNTVTDEILKSYPANEVFTDRVDF